MRDSELAISDAHKFADKLSNDLSLLDGVSLNLSSQTVFRESLVEPIIKYLSTNAWSIWDVVMCAVSATHASR